PRAPTFLKRGVFSAFGCGPVTNTHPHGSASCRTVPAEQGATCHRDRPTGDADESYPGGQYFILSKSTSKESSRSRGERPPGMTRAALIDSSIQIPGSSTAVDGKNE